MSEDYDRMDRGVFWLAVIGFACCALAIVASVIAYVTR
jgi:hypothetical protein